MLRSAWPGGRSRVEDPERDGYGSEEVEGDARRDIRQLQSAARRGEELVQWRDKMAENMWQQYQNTLVGRQNGQSTWRHA